MSTPVGNAGHGSHSCSLAVAGVAGVTFAMLAHLRTAHGASHFFFAFLLVTYHPVSFSPSLMNAPVIALGRLWNGYISCLSALQLQLLRGSP